MKRPDPDQVHKELREAIRDEVWAEVNEATRVLRYKQNIFYGVLAALIVIAAWSGSHQRTDVAKTVHGQAAADKDRRDQNCLLFERSYLSAVQQLSDTYVYLVRLSRPERRQTINLAIRANLPKLESNVRTTRPPKYCEPANVGSGQPVPLPPRRPDALP